MNDDLRPPQAGGSQVERVVMALESKRDDEAYAESLKRQLAPAERLALVAGANKWQ